MSKNEEARQIDIPEDALISNPSRPVVRLRGSNSSQQELRPALSLRRRNGDPDPGDGDPPPPPPPAVSTPDLAIQVSPCLPLVLEGGIVSAVRQALNNPNADVRSACINGTERVGVWLRPVLNTQDSQARDRGLQRLSFLNTGETLAFFINSALIRRLAMDSWNAAPKRLNGDGVSDDNGPVHLTSFDVSLESPNRVITRIGGFDERPWPDVNFQLTITDTLSVSGGQVHCDSQRKLDVDTSWLNFLSGVFLILVPPLGAVFLYERIVVGSAGAPDIDAGAGCSAARMIPQEILIPFGQKVVASYSRAEVFSGGIIAGGSFIVIARSPEVTITGPTQVAVQEGSSTLTRSYRLQTDDLRPDLQIAWSGDGFALPANAEGIAFRFNLAGAQVGQVLTRRVAVRVTDADGLVASSQLIVTIHITPEEDDDGLPPVCRIKPWLPQCQR